MYLDSYHIKSLLKRYKVPSLEGRVIFNPEQKHRIRSFIKDAEQWVITPIFDGSNLNSKKLATVVADKDLETSIDNIFKTIAESEDTNIKAVKLYVEKLPNAQNKLSLKFFIDRNYAQIILMVSNKSLTAETIKEEDTIAIKIDYYLGIQAWQIKQVLKKFNITHTKQAFVDFVANLYKFFIAVDASLLDVYEIIKTEDKFFIKDANIIIDDSSAKNNPLVKTLLHTYGANEQSKISAIRQSLGFNQLNIDNPLSVIFNGSDLGLAIYDVLVKEKLQINQLVDVSVVADIDKIKEAFSIIHFNKKMQVILLIIVGSVLDSKVYLEHIRDFIQQYRIKVPVVLLGNTEVFLELQEQDLNNQEIYNNMFVYDEISLAIEQAKTIIKVS